MTIDNPTISVLIACFNCEKYVGETLESVLAQTRLADEIIVVDDGSTDQSASKVQSYADRGIQLICQDNQGASAARNRAFAASTGQFVIFVDADDIIGPLHLESLLSRVYDHRRCVALSKWDRFYSLPEEASFPDRPTECDMSGIDWLMLDWEGGRPMTQSGMFLIPRVLIEERGPWCENLTLIDDFEFFARIILHSDGVRFARGACLYYRSGRSGSLSAQKTRHAVESAFDSLMLGVSHVLAVESSPRTRHVCANILQDFDYTYYPHHSDLRRKIRDRVAELGGATREPNGPPGFHQLRRFTGWKIARQVQRFAERYNLNRSALTGR